jgi:AcrR family transcriptional regulator
VGHVTNPAPAPRRADAQRNYCALQRAARDVFAERGIDAPLDEIAHRAGIGNATLYRHFPTRCDLVVAVFTEQMEEYAAAVQTAAAAEDPWLGFRSYVTTICEIQAGNRGLADLLTTTSISSPHLDALRSSSRRNLIRVVRRAQRAGALRADFSPQDVVLIMMANAGVVRRTVDHAPDSSARLVSLILDGLAASAATNGPAPPKERCIVEAMREAP